MRSLNSWKIGAVMALAGAASSFAALSGVTWSVNNSTRTYVYTRGVTIAPDTATTAGAGAADTLAAGANACGTAPALPAGLSIARIASNKCVISGTPTATSPTTLYLVQFRAQAGNDSMSFLRITVGPVTNLTYPTNVITGTVGRLLTAVTPTLGLSTGTMVYTADSLLPPGFTLASATGVIAGTPTATFAGRLYIITATNGTDTTRASVRIEANAAVSHSAWSGHKAITVNPTGLNLGAAVTNFPVLVRLTAGNSDVFLASKTGADVRFTAADSVTPLSFQIERWDSTAKAAEIWVNVPVVSNTANTTFIMHYGMSGQTTASSGPATFSTANGFQGVWHMSGAAASAESDATANAYHATPTGTTSTTGAIGAARAFDGASYLRATGTASGALNFPANSAWTISTWVTASATQRLTVVSKSNFQYALQTGYDQSAWETVEYLNVLQPGGSTVLRAGWPHAFSPIDSVKAGGAWMNVVGVSLAGGLYTYVNGNLVGNNLQGIGWNANGTTARVVSSDVVIGGMFEAANSTTFARGWDSKIDEVQMSNVARDSNWIRLAYATQRANTTAVSVAGTLATAPDAPVGVTAVLAGSGSVAVTWVAPANNGGAAITGYKAMAVSDTTKFCTTTGALTCTITGLPSGVYTFVAKATNSAGTSVNSTASASVVGILSGANANHGIFSVSQRNGRFVFSLPEGAQAGRIQISDMRGRQVWSMSMNGNEASWNGLLANGKPLNRGTYLVRFTGPDAKAWDTKLAYTH